MTKIFSISTATIATFALCSCGTMKAIKSGAVSSVSKVGDSVGSSVSKVGSGFSKVGDSVGNGFGKIADAATSPFKPGLPVVEARESDLKKMPSGHEQALAYQKEQQRRRGWWIFGGDVDFEEPSLPDLPMNAEAGLLPLLPPLE
jgi:phage-related protein